MSLPDPLAVLAALTVLAVAWAAGRLLGPVFAADDGPAFRAALGALAGLLALYVWMQLLDAIGVPWSAAAVLGPLLGVAAVGPALAPARRSGPAHPSGSVARRRRERWVNRMPLVVPAAAFALAGAILLLPATTMSDVVFHWGIKAQRFAIVGGVDLEFLRAPWNLQRHPDYPYLVPSWWVAATLLRGSWHTAIPLASTVAALGFLAVTVRETLAVARVDRRLTEAIRVLATAVVGAFAIGFVLGGGLDVLVAALATAALPALLGAPTPARAGQIGLIAAALVGAKVEGLPLAALLIAAMAWRLGFATIRRPAVVARLLLPPLLVGVPWWLLVARHGLAQERRMDLGALDLERALTVARALLDVVPHPAWHGFWIVVVLLPALLLPRATRLPAAVLLAQLAFYLFVYLTTTADPAYLVATSAQRLVLHVLPATLVLVGVAWGAPTARIDQLLVEGLQRGDPRALEPADWRALRDQVRERLGERAAERT